MVTATRTTAAVHGAMARLAEWNSRCLAEDFAQAAWFSQFPDGPTPNELARLERARDGWLLLARANHRSARRLNRSRRLRRWLGWS